METSKESMQKPESKLGVKEKFAFLGLNTGVLPLSGLLSVYLLLFYTDVVGLNPVAIGTLFLVARIMDAISDPVMGYILDHLPATKMGRFRPYLILGTILSAVNFVLLWLGPSLAPSGKLVIAYASYLLFSWIFDLMNIPLNSIIAVISDKSKDRSALAAFGALGQLLGGIAVMVLALPIINAFPEERDGFHALILGAAVFILIVPNLGVLGVRERLTYIKQEKYKFPEIRNILGSRPVLMLGLANLISQIGLAVNAAIGVFYFIYVLKSPDLYSILIGTTLVGTVVAAIFAPRFISRFGKKPTMILTFALSMAGSAILVFMPVNVPILFVIIPMLTSPSLGLIIIGTNVVMADNMDYIEWKMGYRAEAAVASINSFIMKAGGGLGAALAAWLLPVIHYVPNAEIQAAETLTGLGYVNYAIPAFFSLLALLVWTFGYPITKSMQEQMHAELTERRKAQEGGIVSQTP